MHKPSLVGVDKAFEEYSGDIIDTLEDYPGVLWMGGGVSSGGDGGVIQ